MKIPAAAVEFEAALKVFDQQAAELSQFAFARQAINNVALRNKRTLAALNLTPMFWNTVAGALQQAAIIAVGRLFDPSSPHNIHRLLRLADRNRHLFSKDAIGARKRHGNANADDWIGEYLARVRVPTTGDFRRLRKFANKYRVIYESQFMDIRHMHVAHRVVVDDTEVSAMFAKTRIRDLERLAATMNQIHDAMWETFHNGRRRFRLRPAAWSSKSLVRRKATDTRARTPQEGIVLAVKQTLRLLTAAAAVERRQQRRRRSAKGRRRLEDDGDWIIESASAMPANAKQATKRRRAVDLHVNR